MASSISTSKVVANCARSLLTRRGANLYARTSLRGGASNLVAGGGTSPAVSAVSVRFLSDSAAAGVVPGVGKGKTSTGLVGLKVDHESIPKIIEKNQALLDKIAASDMPPTAQYRINVEQIARYRIQACIENPEDPEKVEELCNCGQVEELVKQAEDEMIVLDMYLRNRWWEYVKEVEIEYDAGKGGESDHGDIEWDKGLEKNTE